MNEVIDLEFEGNRFLGFLGAVGTLKIVAAQEADAVLGWHFNRRAWLGGVARDRLLDVVHRYLGEREFDPSVTQDAAGKRLPWDVCGGGPVQLRKSLPKILEDLRGNPEKVERALFGPWRWSDENDPLGWEPSLRDHALRARAPTKDKSFRENGAIWLAWEGIEVFGKVDDQPVGWSRADDRLQSLHWPIWFSGASLATVRSLLRSTPKGWKRSGLSEVWRVDRVRAGGKAWAFTVPRLAVEGSRT